jgi:hypothetical protein
MKMDFGDEFGRNTCKFRQCGELAFPVRQHGHGMEQGQASDQVPEIPSDVALDTPRLSLTSPTDRSNKLSKIDSDTLLGRFILDHLRYWAMAFTSCRPPLDVAAINV